MRKLSVCLVFTLCLVAAACTAVPTPAVSPTPVSGAPAKSGTIRFSVQGSLSVKDVPWQMALDSLRAQGYTIQVTEFAKSDLLAVALEHGDVDIGQLASSIAWAAVAKGAEIRTVVGSNNATYYLPVKMEIQTCRDLDGKSLAFSTRQAAGYILFERYLKEECPGANPEIVLIPETRNRLAALQSGELDGAYLELADWLRLDSESPGKYHALIDYGKKYPNFQVTTFYLRPSWAEQHPEMVRDFVRALLTSQRQLASNPKQLEGQIIKLLGVDATEAQRTGEAYLAQGIWDANGGITPENIQYTLDTLVNAGAIPPGLKVEDVADFSYLNAVLDEIGRQ
jgi:ABC-type nitrate/sulfonate/bicarbonate transport system substrate-binding protein